ncbi:MAG: choice-of-anchor Q domain-containing protein, partial [Polyangiales bacterium]
IDATGALYSSGGSVRAIGSLIDGDCSIDSTAEASDGHNIESPGDTCGFDHGTDLVNITEGQLDLGPLRDNGGPTMTHALLPGSVAIDVIPEVDCVDADGAPLTTDQRGESRPGGTMCDVGAFEVQEGSL